jgi:hypothetical protein
MSRSTWYFSNTEDYFYKLSISYTNNIKKTIYRV